MKSLLKSLLRKASVFLYYFLPKEFITIEAKINNRLEVQLIEEKNREVFEILGKDLKQCIRFNKIKSIRKYAIDLALSNKDNLDDNQDLYYLEFGVYQGSSANFFSSYIDKLYAFDSFEGLQDEWGGLSKGTFNLNKKIPRLNSNVEPIVGFVEDTLEEFLQKHNPTINFIHMDMDLYGPTAFTLRKIKPYLAKGCIVLFDELYNYINWKEGEYKALTEVFEEEEFRFRSFHITGKQAVIEIV